MSKIAKTYGVGVDDLVAWNEIADPSLIKVGQVLTVSDPSAKPPPDGKAYTVKSGDTFFAIGQRFGVPFEKLMKVNGYEDPTKLQAGATITIPYKKHTVVAGDTFSEIGAAYGVPYAEIMELNGYNDPTKLQVGVKLKIPFPA